VQAKITTVILAEGRTPAPTSLLLIMGFVILGVSLAGYFGKIPVQGPRWLAPTVGLLIAAVLLGFAVARVTGHLH
jgi:hypothetical protein